MFSSNASQISNDVNYIEDVFSTYLYTGNSATQTITNGIDLAGKGGLVWIKRRTDESHYLFDTNRGPLAELATQATEPSEIKANSLTSFNSDGFSLGSWGGTNYSVAPNNSYASWTFRKQPKFFDVVTYTGNGSDPRNIAHNLGSVPGSMIIKCTSTGATDWFVYHRSLGNSQSLNLNQTGAAETGTQVWGTTTPTSTVFTVGNINSNTNGRTYVAYLFAHDAGGFGLSGNENVVSCGSFTTDGSGNATVSLGYEPQWLMVKASNAGQNWLLFDVMRGMYTGGSSYLNPNAADAETAVTTGGIVAPTATGFTFGGGSISTSATPYIYIAIRRGPMKVPTDGTKVFANSFQNPASAASPPYFISNFPVDLGFRRYRGLDDVGARTFDRLRGNLQLDTASTAAESVYGADQFSYMNGWGGSVFSGASTDVISWMFRRAPSFFDEVCYTGTGAARTVAHNLAAVPELMIVKSRSAAEYGQVYVTPLGNDTALNLFGPSAGGAFYIGDIAWNNTTPTASVFSLGNWTKVNGSGNTFVAYLFATCAGVSKVGSYTGTGTTQAINCGFAAGARFVMIKRTDAAGDWYVWDTARGIVSGNDPHLSLNSTAAEVTGTDYIDPSSAGFEISSTAPAAINASGGSFIFLAIS